MALDTGRFRAHLCPMPALATAHDASPAPARPGRRWLLEVGPVAAIVALLWAKLVHFSVLLPSEWWAPEETIRQWMRPAFHVVSAVQARPELLAATLASLLVLAAFLLLPPRFPRVLALLSLNVFLTSLGITDLVHVRYYADVVSLSDVVMAPMVLGVLPRVFESLSTLNALYYVDIVVGLLLLPWYLRACRRIPPLRRPARIGFGFGLLCAGLVLGAPTARMAWRSGPDLLSYSNPRIEIAAAIGILPYHLGDLALRLAGELPTIGEPERTRVARFLAGHSRHAQRPSPLFGSARGKNLIVINAESLQAFPLDLQIDGQPITPRLSAFARQSLHFVNFYDQTHLGTTSDAEFAAMHSLHPLAVGVLSNHFSYNRHRGLPRILSEHGYATLSACAAPPYFWNMRAMHAGLGFQRSFFEDRYRMTELIGPWLADHEFFGQTMPILEAQPAPFMAFLLTASNHHPYRLPREHRELSLGELEGTLLGDYLQSVRYFDRAFGVFVDRLGAAGLLDRSVIVIYGDHHGFLGDPPELGRLLGIPARDEYRTLQVRKKVPMMIRLPHAEKAGVKTVTGGHLDIAPTVLALLGIRRESGLMLGRDLTPGQNSLVVFRDGSFTDGTTWYAHRVGATAGTCYAVKTGQRVDCGAVAEQRREARTRLEISDLVVRGDLIPSLHASRVGRVDDRVARRTGIDGRRAPPAPAK
ncbi:MAG TPA: LTA synthase family protein [Methylomirabilota bacterium]|nr:LTA synthase family protein [Methylomirabilota bacterium]